MDVFGGVSVEKVTFKTYQGKTLTLNPQNAGGSSPKASFNFNKQCMVGIEGTNDKDKTTGLLGLGAIYSGDYNTQMASLKSPSGSGGSGGTGVGSAVSGGFLTGWFFNWLLWMLSAGKIIGCNTMAFWGLAFLNDDGALFHKCLTTGVVGAKATYI